jgi:hypothetical protein
LKTSFVDVIPAAIVDWPAGILFFLAGVLIHSGLFVLVIFGVSKLLNVIPRFCP